MRPPAFQILELALALQRAPGERFRLRERPLPDGLVRVIEVAAGSPQALAAAATELGESEHTILEAARFYLEQVLFATPDADAYRILGVAPDAPTDLIRTHHRWLQRWLHPDRAQAGDASVYATRVNQAWATLRTLESRHQYEVRLAEARLAGASAPLPASTVRHWEAEDSEPTHGRRSRWLLATALAACVVLAVLIVRHEQGPQPWVPNDEPQPVAAAPVTLAPDIEDRDLGLLTEALMAKPVETSLVGAAEAAIPEVMEPPVAAPAAPTREIPAPRPTPAGTRITSTPTIQYAAATPAPVAPRRPHPERPEPLPVGAAKATPPKPVAIPVAAPAAPTSEIAATPPTPDPSLLLDRMAKAEQRVAQVTAYLAAQPGAAPLWNDIRTAQDAERIRTRMAARDGTALELARPDWQLQRDNATLRVDYRCDGCRVRQGRLDVQLVWREGLWLVRGIGLAPAA